MIIETPDIFNYRECLHYLNRSDLELGYQVQGEVIRKLVRFGNELVLFSVSPVRSQDLQIEFLLPTSAPDKKILKSAQQYIREWFDLDTDLEAFYEAARSNSVIRQLTEEFRGLRLIRIPDLFEAMSWAIIGQQINLKFAYKIKNALVSQYGESIIFEGQKYYAFPKPETIAACSETALRQLQFSRQKASYLTGLARSFANREISKKKLQGYKLEKALATLTQLKGFGEWSAHYVLMRCLGHRTALPLQDAGLKNALKHFYGLEEQPSKTELQKLTQNWAPWQAYYTFYLWRSLLKPV